MKFALILALVAVAAFAPTQTLGEQSGNFCQDCRSTMSYLSKFNTSSQQDSFSEALQHFCAIYYPPSMDNRNGPCDLIVSSAMYLLKQTDPVHHCDQIGACTTESQPPQLNAVVSIQRNPLEANVFCDVCLTGIQSVKAQLSNQEMLQQLRSALESFCEYLKLIDKSEECKVHIPEIISYIQNTADKIDPQRYCESIRVCSPKTLMQVFLNSIPMLQDGFGLFVDGQAMSQESLFQKTEIPSRGGKVVDITIESASTPLSSSKTSLESIDKSHKKGPTCMLCKFVIAELNHILKNNRTEENIKHSLDNLCDKIYRNNDSKKGKCESLVNKYSDKIVEILAQEMNPEIVCIMLEQCVYVKEDELGSAVTSKPYEEKTEIVKTGTISDLFVALDSSLTHGSFEVCVECKLFIKYLQQVMKNPENEREMKEVLKQDLCGKLSSPNREECDKLIDKYAQILFEAVAKNMKPGETCQILGACHKKQLLVEDAWAKLEALLAEITADSALSPSSTQAPAPVKETLCDQCQQIIESIDKYISTEDVDNNVNKIVENVCNKMEPSLAQKCAYVVEMFGTEIVSVISNMQDPKQVCQKVFLC